MTIIAEGNKLDEPFARSQVRLALAAAVSFMGDKPSHDELATVAMLLRKATATVNLMLDERADGL